MPAVAGSKAGTWRHRAPYIKDQRAAARGRGAYGPELTRPWSSPSSPPSCLFAGDERLGVADRDALSGGHVDEVALSSALGLPEDRGDL